MEQINPMIEFVIQGELPSTNEVLNTAKGHRMKYSTLKKKADNLVKLSCSHIPKIHKNAHFKIVYLCKNKKKDKDNISFAKKFIFDGLVNAKKMDNDGWDEVSSWEESFGVDKLNPRIIVSIT